MKTMRALSLIAAIAFAAAPVFAQRQEPLPADLEDVGIDEHLGDNVPLDASFTDETGRRVTLAEYFESGRPVILNLGYFSCPMLCGLVTNGMLEGLEGLAWTPGDKFAVITLSIDPLESHTLAKLKKQNYIKEFGRPAAATGWHFLTGAEPQIKRVTEAVGFNYAWNDDRQEYAHAAALFVLTPEGKISRYLYGIEHSPKDLRLALLEASEGKMGSAFDKILLYCFYYDSAKGRYAPAAMNMMRGGGFLTILVLGVGILVMKRRESRRADPAA
ncbi:MAG: SCO family protein [Gemmatimonadetes bacterium]|nr:SCO family protein [Gemmatimonadota bacterium]